MADLPDPRHLVTYRWLLAAQLLLMVAGVKTPGLLGVALDVASLGCLVANMALRGTNRRKTTDV